MSGRGLVYDGQPSLLSYLVFLKAELIPRHLPKAKESPRRTHFGDNPTTRFVIRDFVRDAVFAFNTPLLAALSIALYTRESIASASFLLPAMMRWLISLMESFNSFFRRALKTPRRFATPIAFLAELVIAIVARYYIRTLPPANENSPSSRGDTLPARRSFGAGGQMSRSHLEDRERPREFPHTGY